MPRPSRRPEVGPPTKAQAAWDFKKAQIAEYRAKHPPAKKRVADMLRAPKRTVRRLDEFHSGFMDL